MQILDKLKHGRQSNKARPSPVFILLLFILVSLIAGFLFLRSTYFLVGSVVVEGNSGLSVDEIYHIAGIPDKINIFRLDTSEIKDRLLGDLRVEDAEVSRQFPATIVIRVTERRSLAYIANSFGFVLLDKQGMVLAALKSIKQFNVPIITGVQAGTAYVGDKVETPPIKSILPYLAALDENTLSQLSEINVRPSGELVAYTVQSIMIRLGNSERLTEKAKSTQDILRDIGVKKSAVEYIDLNYVSPYIKFRQ